MKDFRKDNDMERKIVLKDKPKGLDRERNETFTLEIYVTNDPTGGDYDINKKGSILHVSIVCLHVCVCVCVCVCVSPSVCQPFLSLACLSVLPVVMGHTFSLDILSI